MAFSRTGLARTSSSGNTNANASWTYTSSDTIAVQAASAYFNSANREFRRNDKIILVDTTNNVVSETYVTSADDATPVTVNPPLALTQGSSIADVGAITAYSAHASGGTAVTSNAATDLDTTAAALATLRGEVASMRTQVNLIITGLEVSGLNATV